MSWPTQPKAPQVAITKFAPAKPVAGLTDEARAALRQRRERETRRVEPAAPLYEVRNACNVFLYGNFVELVDARPDPADCVPDPPKPRPPYDELYVKQRRQANGI